MTTEQTAQQLELAAQILRTGHPWEHNPYKEPQWLSGFGKCPLQRLANGNKIRLALATPPDGRPLHNPDNLDAEQVGAGWRLALKGERAHEGEIWTGMAWSKNHVCTYVNEATFRLPLSVPWLEPQPDLYAELKKAHAEGKVIQGCIRGHWIDCPHPTWKYPVDSYRKKPDEKKTVPQDSTFFFPSTAIRFPKGSDHWSVVATLDSHGLIVEEKLYSFQELFDLKAMANRSIPLTGKWNPDAWEPCHKQTDA